jgi:hypothetical protein
MRADQKERMMGEYSFDGKVLRNKAGQKMGEIERGSVRAWNGARLGEIEKKNIRNPQGKKILEFDGKNVKDDLGNKVISMKEIQDLIDGEPGINLAAAWHFLVKNKQTNFT